jgi:hypothetical protein
MSGLVAGKVWQSVLDPALKPLAAALADIANDDGSRIYPSVAYMAWLLGRSERAVQSGLTKLRATGVLGVVRNGSGGRGRTTEYRLNISNLPSRPSWRESRNGAESAGFRTEKGESTGRKGEASGGKGCSSRRERVKRDAPEPSLTVREPLGETSSETGASDKEESGPPSNNPPSEVAVAIADLLRQCILENNPKAKITDRQQEQWADVADRMMRLDGRAESEIRELIDWSQHDEFWHTNILSMAKLREKWDQLVVKRQVQCGRRNGPSRADSDRYPVGPEYESKIPTATDCRPEH